MKATEKIYRVVVRRAGSLQPSGTFWRREVLYCGTDLAEARTAYLRSEPEDGGGSYGNPCRETFIRSFDATPDEINDYTASPVPVD